jgi:hypothetical protein
MLCDMSMPYLGISLLKSIVGQARHIEFSALAVVTGALTAMRSQCLMETSVLFLVAKPNWSDCHVQ